MRSPVAAAFLPIAMAALTLAACTAEPIESGGAVIVAPREGAVSGRSAGGVVRRGDSFAMMSEQYAPRAAGGPVATGASAWVEPAPPPAFVAAGPLPPADPPAPPLAAVANRQPGAADIERPEAAAPSPAPRTAGQALFNTFACGACHGFADAGASGAVGPSLDDNPRLTRAYAIDVIGNGRGAMPSFGGQMSDEEIAALADYLVRFARH